MFYNKKELIEQYIGVKNIFNFTKSRDDKLTDAFTLDHMSVVPLYLSIKRERIENSISQKAPLCEHKQSFIIK